MGTGKTTWVSAWIDDAATKYGGESVFVGSFTRAAAVELASRRLPIPQGNVGTLHSHCHRLLDRPTIAEGLVDDWNAEIRRERFDWMLSEGRKNVDNPEQETWMGRTEGDELMRQTQWLRARMIPPDAWESFDARAFQARWNQFKSDTSSIDFTDLIEVALHEHHTPANVSIGFFDEVQDFTPLELALIRSWRDRMDFVVLAGDDDQCIYSFKGATPDAFLDPPVDDAHKRILGQSFRVPGAVHERSQNWVQRLTRREPKEYLPRREVVDGPDGPALGDIVPGLVTPAEVSYVEAEGVVDLVEARTARGQTVMVLASCGYMLDAIRDELRDRGLPFHNPYRRSRGDWNPLGASRGVSSTQRLLAFLRPDGTVWGDEARMWSMQDVAMWLAVLKTEGLMKRGMKAKLTDIKPDEAGRTHSREISLDELFAIFEDGGQGAMTLELDWFEKHLLPPRRGPMSFPLTVARKHGGAALIGQPKVVIGTIHSVKGGEADVVILFPDLSARGMEEWEAGGVARDSVVRQFYVGMTRAREELVLCESATGLHVEGM